MFFLKKYLPLLCLIITAVLSSQGAAEIKQCLDYEDFTRIRQLMEERRFSHDCGLDQMDCRLLAGEEACLRDKVNPCSHEDESYLESFLDELYRNPQWALYLTTAYSHLGPLVKQKFKSFYAPQLSSIGIGLVSLVEALAIALVNPFMSVQESVKGHDDCFAPNRKKLYNEIAVQNSNEELTRLVGHLGINTAITIFLNFYLSSYKPYFMQQGAVELFQRVEHVAHIIHLVQYPQ